MARSKPKLTYVRHVSGDHEGMFESFDLSDPARKAALEALGNAVVEVDPETGEQK
jgi:hypothetical protein